MISFGKTVINPLKESRGFTLIELIVITVMISILITIAIANYIPLKNKALDATARVDARNLVDAVTDAMLSGESVDYLKADNTGGFVGDTDAGGVARAPVYILSPGVRVYNMTGDSTQGDGSQTIFSAYLYHENGTVDTTGAGSNRKEYYVSVDETSGVTSLPD